MAGREALEPRAVPDQLEASHRDFGLELEELERKPESREEVDFPILAMVLLEAKRHAPATVAAGRAVVAEVAELVERVDCPAEEERRLEAREPSVAERLADCLQALRRHWP